VDIAISFKELASWWAQRSRFHARIIHAQASQSSGATETMHVDGFKAQLLKVTQIGYMYLRSMPTSIEQQQGDERAFPEGSAGGARFCASGEPARKLHAGSLSCTLPEHSTLPPAEPPLLAVHACITHLV